GRSGTAPRRPRTTMTTDRTTFTRLEQLPNVGKATAGDLRLLGIDVPQQLVGRDPYALYDELCRITNQRHDPCVMDVLIAVVRFMEGGPAVPWWTFTPERKRHLAQRDAPTPP
ncbi:MAG TPA: helix-hairpin-helix domain-containing protein, partial [Gemmatimonadaceae bacterium]|nr:helix-hairpin-helix domain-containing protein [Gemmatimonadaceae bacterium]